MTGRIGKCYIAGPMTGYPGFNYKAFDDAKAELQARGWEVISPADLDRQNLGIEFDKMTGHEDLSEHATAFARQDIDALLKVSAVFCLDGWEQSTGAMNEIRIASMLGVPCWSFATDNSVGVVAQFSGAATPLGEERVTNAVTGGQKGSKGERYDLIPAEPLAALARHYGVGAKKYEDRNWERGYDWSLSFAALQRHAWQFWGGEDVDEETGSHHMAAVIFHAMALIEFASTHPELDNRP